MNVQFFQEACCRKDAIRSPECGWMIEFESLLCAICAGFMLVNREAHHSFGNDLEEKYWELNL